MALVDRASSSFGEADLHCIPIGGFVSVSRIATVAEDGFVTTWLIDRGDVGAEPRVQLRPSLQWDATGTQFALTTAVPQYATRDTRHCDPA